MNFTKMYIPQANWNTTGVYLLLSYYVGLTPTVRDNLLNASRVYLATTGLFFSSPMIQARQMFPQETALFSWYAVNYLVNGINATSQQMIGILDIGIVTAQIAFIPATNNNPSESFSANTRTNSYIGFASVFQYYDLSSAFFRVKNLLSGNITGIPNPCYLTAYTEDVPYNSTANVTYVGTGNYDQCLNLTVSIINSTCTTPPCVLNGVLVPAPQGSFYALDGFVQTVNFLGFTEPVPVNLVTLNASVVNYCTSNFNTIKNANPGISVTFLKNVCFNGIYILALLINGFGITAADNVSFITEINGILVTPGFGAMVYEEFIANYTILPTTAITTAATGDTSQTLFSSTTAATGVTATGASATGATATGASATVAHTTQAYANMASGLFETAIFAMIALIFVIVLS